MKASLFIELLGEARDGLDKNHKTWSRRYSQRNGERAACLRYFLAELVVLERHCMDAGVGFGNALVDSIAGSLRLLFHAVAGIEVKSVRMDMLKETRREWIAHWFGGNEVDRLGYKAAIGECYGAEYACGL